MLALGEPEDDFDVGMVEGVAELLDEPAAERPPGRPSREVPGPDGRDRPDGEEFLATYSLVIRIRPTRFLPWHGGRRPRARRRRPRSTAGSQAAIRRVAGTLVAPRAVPATLVSGGAADGRRAAWPRTSRSTLGRSAATLQVGEDLAGRVLARLAGDPAARVGAGPAQVEPVDREAVAAAAEERPPQEELVEGLLAVERMAAATARSPARGRAA